MRYKKNLDSISHKQQKQHTAKIYLCPPVIRNKKNYFSC